MNIGHESDVQAGAPWRGGYQRRRRRPKAVAFFFLAPAYVSVVAFLGVLGAFGEFGVAAWLSVMLLAAFLSSPFIIVYAVLVDDLVPVPSAVAAFVCMAAGVMGGPWMVTQSIGADAATLMSGLILLFTPPLSALTGVPALAAGWGIRRMRTLPEDS